MCEVLAHHSGHTPDRCFKAFAAVLLLKLNMLDHTATVGIKPLSSRSPSNR